MTWQKIKREGAYPLLLWAFALYRLWLFFLDGCLFLVLYFGIYTSLVYGDWDFKLLGYY